VFLSVEKAVIFITMETKQINKSLKEMSSAFSRATDSELIFNFLECLLTKNEISEVASRWELVKMLDHGVSQRNIASELGLSLCKITRGSKELQKTDSAFKKMIDLV
jgi:TrpR family trp operon transcriptional repressor